MSAIYKRADADVLSVVAVVIEAHHKHLADAGVVVDVIMADGGMDKLNRRKVALRRRGFPCAGLVTVTNQKQRTAGMRDALIFLDLAAWERLSPRSREALVDHELMHLSVSGDNDACGRPVLSLIPHDWEIGGFSLNIERYQRNSLEAQMLAHVMSQDQVKGGFAQLEFAMTAGPGGKPVRRRLPLECGLAALLAMGDFEAPAGDGDDAAGDDVPGDDVELPEGGPVALDGSGQGDPSSGQGPVSPASSSGLETTPDETLVAQAVETIRETRRATVSSLQRRLRIGYLAACRLMDLLEARGIVGPSNGAKGREILMPADYQAA